MMRRWYTALIGAGVVGAYGMIAALWAAYCWQGQSRSLDAWMLAGVCATVALGCWGVGLALVALDWCRQEFGGGDHGR